MKKPNYYHRLFRQNHSKVESMEMLLHLYDYKRISGQITNEQYNRIFDVLFLKNKWENARKAVVRETRKEYKITFIKGDLYGLQNGKLYNYNELYFK